MIHKKASFTPRPVSISGSLAPTPHASEGRDGPRTSQPHASHLANHNHITGSLHASHNSAHTHTLIMFTAHPVLTGRNQKRRREAEIIECHCTSSISRSRPACVSGSRAALSSGACSSKDASKKSADIITCSAHPSSCSIPSSRSFMFSSCCCSRWAFALTAAASAAAVSFFEGGRLRAVGGFVFGSTFVGGASMTA